MRRLKKGLPYGWWKDIDMWANAVMLTGLTALGACLIAAWLFDLKPWW